MTPEGPPQPPGSELEHTAEQEAETAQIKECLENERVVALDEKVTMPAVMEWKRKFEELTKKDKTPVVLLINSSGGDAQIMRALDHAIAKSEVTVYSLAAGRAHSAAFFALFMGQKIYATPDSTIQPHEGVTPPKLTKTAPERVLKIQQRAAEKTSSYFAQKVGQRTNRSPEQISALMIENERISAQEAKDQGLIDGTFPMSAKEAQGFVKKE